MPSKINLDDALPYSISELQEKKLQIVNDAILNELKEKYKDSININERYEIGRLYNERLDELRNHSNSMFSEF